jgi:hypothetical protein
MLERISGPLPLVSYALLVVNPDGHNFVELFRQAYLEIEGYLLLNTTKLLPFTKCKTLEASE